jgi:23S rRNA (cytidine2498-2'-O)-methyltransferase
MECTGYLAAEGYEEQLLGEIGPVLERHGRLFLAAGPPRRAHWAQNVWLAPRKLRIRSVADAARQLRSIQRNWALYSHLLHRRAELIQRELPHVSAKPLQFPSLPPSSPLGSWTLVERDAILASPRSSSPFPNGEARFVEFKEGPPNRAYLKLWEALALLGSWPSPGERCLDAGASPGGWTWALARLGTRVLAVDRAPLHPSIAAMAGVEYRQGSAFSFDPRAESFDWITSDVVSYPERLWGWIRRWLDSGACPNFVCTLKFQGNSHYGVISEFASVPGSRLLHLSRNRHELTWILAGSCGKSSRGIR